MAEQRDGTSPPGRERAEQEFGVDSTPTFFINGEIVRGAESMEEFKKLIDAALAA